MVKHAAAVGSPLLTAEERVNAAIAQCDRGRDLTADEQQWLEYIRRHLAQNLSIDRKDFETFRSCPITAAGVAPTASSPASWSGWSLT